MLVFRRSLAWKCASARLLLILFVLFLIHLAVTGLIFSVSLTIAYFLGNAQPIYRINGLVLYMPRWARPFVNPYLPQYLFPITPLAPINDLLDAPRPGECDLPPLSRPDCDHDGYFTANGTTFFDPNNVMTTALVKIHVFSTAFPKHRPRRDVIIRHSPLRTVPLEYRHLIEVKFVVGRTNITEDEASLDAEQAEFGDLIRLEDLVDGENMNKGKTSRWIRHIGSEGERKAWWVFKCDDDTFPILPNLLPWVLSMDPHTPTYFGTSMGHNYGLGHYYLGSLYGFSYGIVQTIAAAHLSDEVIDLNYPEDARTGWLMYNLPSKSGQPRGPDEAREWTNNIPPNPDPRTGLIRAETGLRMPDLGHWWGASWYNVFAWHKLKADSPFESMWQKFERDFASMGWEFMWRVPWWLRHLRIEDRCLSRIKPLLS